MPYDLMPSSWVFYVFLVQAFQTFLLSYWLVSNLLSRQGSCKKEVGNQDGFERMKRVVTVMLGDTGKQEKRPTGKRFQIYLDRLLIYLPLQWTNNPPFCSASLPHWTCEGRVGYPEELLRSRRWSFVKLKVTNSSLKLWFVSCLFMKWHVWYSVSEIFIVHRQILIKLTCVHMAACVLAHIDIYKAIVPTDHRLSE